MAKTKVHPFWNFPIIGIIVSLIPVIAYEWRHLATNVWLDNGSVKTIAYLISMTIAGIVCSYSYQRLKDGQKEWRYRVVFIIFILGVCSIADYNKYGHDIEKSPVVLELYKTENMNSGRSENETIIIFRKNGTCRFTIQRAEYYSYLETTYTKLDTIYTINATESVGNIVPHQLKNDDGFYYGQIHLWKGSKGVDVYYKATVDHRYK